MCNPVGAIVRAIIAIYDLVMWLVDNIQRILSFVNSVVDSVAAIAVGQIGGAANYIESSIAKTIPMILSGLAQFLKLGGIAEKIQDTIKKVRAPIDDAIDKGIGFVVDKVKSWFGKKPAGDEENENDEDSEELEDVEVGKVVRFTADEESHKIWIDTKGSSPKVMSASTKMTAEERLQKWKSKLSTLSEAQEAEAKGLINSAQSELGITEPAAKVAKKEIDEAETKKTAVENNQAKTADDKVESSEDKLKRYFKRLFELFGEEEEEVKLEKYIVEPFFTVYANNPSEFISQLRNQEAGINKMKVTRWMENREDFVKNGRREDDLKKVRERIRADIATNYKQQNFLKFVNDGLSPNEIDKKAQDYAKTILTRNHAILHNPDQVAGGEAMLGELYNEGDITDATSLAASKLVGHRGTNSSLGSQWSKERAANLYTNTKAQHKNLQPEQQKVAKMNVELKHN